MFRKNSVWNFFLCFQTQKILSMKTWWKKYNFGRKLSGQTFPHKHAKKVECPNYPRSTSIFEGSIDNFTLVEKQAMGEPFFWCLQEDPFSSRKTKVVLITILKLFKVCFLKTKLDSLLSPWYQRKALFFRQFYPFESSWTSFLHNNSDTPKIPKTVVRDTTSQCSLAGIKKNYSYFLRHGQDRKIQNCKGRLHWKTFEFDPCIRIMIIWKFEKRQPKMIYLGDQIENSCFRQIKFLLSVSQMKKLPLNRSTGWETFWCVSFCKNWIVRE